MKFGYTTGSCAAAASKAAAFMLLTGKIKTEITITTPKGIDFHAKIVDINRSEREVSCAVVKDGGDDPDITTGAHVFSTVRFVDEKDCRVKVRTTTTVRKPDNDKNEKTSQIIIKGGRGVGKVTKPGLDQKVGNAAINHVPREMIEKEVLEVCHICDYNGTLEVEISVPEGEELAEKTFNPRLGIVGGISILGTSGIVEPMSSQALKDTILIELKQQKELGAKVATVAPGNYGLDFMKVTFDFDLDKAVKCSNFIGETVDMAIQVGFEKMLLVGHIGKLIKVSGGIMNTHSHEADCRMELLAAAAIKSGCSAETARAILDCVSTEEGIRKIKEEDCRVQVRTTTNVRKPDNDRNCKLDNDKSEKSCHSEHVSESNYKNSTNSIDHSIFRKSMDYIMERILFYLNKRAEGKLEIACILFCNEFGLLAKSANAEKMLDEAKQ